MNDPVLVWIARLALAALFATAARHKLRDLLVFRATLADYRLLPARATGPASIALVAAELGVALLLVIPANPSWTPPPAAAWGALALLGLYTGAITWNLARGRRHIDCGCLGPGHRAQRGQRGQPVQPGQAGSQPLSGWLVVRNVLLAAVALPLLLPASGRAWSWVDGVSVAGGFLSCVLIWTAVHTLVEARPHRILAERVA